MFGSSVLLLSFLFSFFPLEVVFRLSFKTLDQTINKATQQNASSPLAPSQAPLALQINTAVIVAPPVDSACFNGSLDALTPVAVATLATFCALALLALVVRCRSTLEPDDSRISKLLSLRYCVALCVRKSCRASRCDPRRRRLLHHDEADDGLYRYVRRRCSLRFARRSSNGTCRVEAVIVSPPLSERCASRLSLASAGLSSSLCCHFSSCLAVCYRASAALSTIVHCLACACAVVRLLLTTTIAATIPAATTAALFAAQCLCAPCVDLVVNVAVAILSPFRWFLLLSFSAPPALLMIDDPLARLTLLLACLCTSIAFLERAVANVNASRQFLAEDQQHSRFQHSPSRHCNGRSLPQTNPACHGCCASPTMTPDHDAEALAAQDFARLSTIGCVEKNPGMTVRNTSAATRDALLSRNASARERRVRMHSVSREASLLEEERREPVSPVGNNQNASPVSHSQLSGLSPIAAAASTPSTRFSAAARASVQPKLAPLSQPAARGSALLEAPTAAAPLPSLNRNADNSKHQSQQSPSATAAPPMIRSAAPPAKVATASTTAACAAPPNARKSSAPPPAKSSAASAASASTTAAATSSTATTATASYKSMQQRLQAVIPPIGTVALLSLAPTSYNSRKGKASKTTTQASAEPDSFFNSYFLLQDHALNSTTFMRVVEDFEEKVDGHWQAPRRRTVIIALKGDARYFSSADPAVLEGALRAAIPVAEQLHPIGRHLTKKEAEKVADDAKKKRIRKVRVFPDCDATEEGSHKLFKYGRFPLLPGLTSSCDTFRVTYSSMRVLLPAEIAALPSAAALRDSNPDRYGGATANLTDDNNVAHAPTDTKGKQHWTSSTDLSDDVVDAHLADFGTPVAMERRAAEGHLRKAFQQRCADVLADYRGCCDPAKRDRKIRRLLAFFRMHMKRLQGTASARVRQTFARQQLNHQVCTQTVVSVNEKARKAPTPEEFAERCVRAAFRLCTQNLIGRACSTLVRTIAPEVSTEQKVEDLRKLHPSGEPAIGVALSDKVAFNDKSFSIEDIRKSVKAACNGSSPGPCGWTFEALYDALEHDGFAGCFHSMIVDICNGNISDGTARLLAASALVGIPKGTTADAGTRPLALGGVFLKVACTRSVHAASKALLQRFHGSQYGCAVKGGAEYIVHQTRRFIRDGKRTNGNSAPVSRVVVTIDFANAFNCLHRQAMWDSVKNIPELRGIFNISYKQHADLFIAGSDVVLKSQRGARQGTVDGPVDFALALQPVLNAVNTVAGVQALAYLDDVTIHADDLESANRAVMTIAAESAKLGLSIKSTKCELFIVEVDFYKARMPAAAPWRFPADPNNLVLPHGTDWQLLRDFRRVQVIKLLGASIAANDATESLHLFQREHDKAAMLFSRLRMGASPQFFTVLRSCAIPKLSYAVRNHSSTTARNLCQNFDARVEDLMSYWSSIAELNADQRLILALPLRYGGMGLTRLEMIAAASYYASMSTALEGARRVTDQAALCSIVYRDQYDQAVSRNSSLRRHLEVHSLEGSDAGLSCLDVRVHPDVFGALLRNYLAGDARTVAANTAALPCRGCKRPFSIGGSWGQHVSNCVAMSGGHVTKRHQAVAHLCRQGLAEAGYAPDKTEPRDLATYRCACRSEPLSLTKRSSSTHKLATCQLRSCTHRALTFASTRAVGRTLLMLRLSTCSRTPTSQSPRKMLSRQLANSSCPNTS